MLDQTFNPVNLVLSLSIFWPSVGLPKLPIGLFSTQNFVCSVLRWPHILTIFTVNFYSSCNLRTFLNEQFTIDKSSGWPKGVGFVRYSSSEEAKVAEGAGPHCLGGFHLQINKVVTPKVSQSVVFSKTAYNSCLLKDLLRLPCWSGFALAVLVLLMKVTQHSHVLHQQKWSFWLICGVFSKSSYGRMFCLYQ